MKIVGLAGGIASGKTWVSKQLQSLGAAAIDADKLGHEVLAESDVRNQIVNRWGQEVLDDQGEIDRSRLAKIVFAEPPSGPVQLKHLERITHPRIERRMQQQFERLRAQSRSMVVVDAPVMFKAGWDKLCDHLIFVDARREDRLERASRRGWSEAHFEKREQAQLSLEEKRARCDYVIENSGDSDEASAQVEKIWAAIVKQDGNIGV